MFGREWVGRGGGVCVAVAVLPQFQENCEGPAYDSRCPYATIQETRAAMQLSILVAGDVAVSPGLREMAAQDLVPANHVLFPNSLRDSRHVWVIQWWSSVQWARGPGEPGCNALKQDGAKDVVSVPLGEGGLQSCKGFNPNGFRTRVRAVTDMIVGFIRKLAQGACGRRT